MIKRRRRPLLAAVVVSLGLIAACGGGEADDDTRARTADTGVEDEEAAPEEDATDPSSETTIEASSGAGDGEGWTVLLYSIADTDLEPFLLADAAEMAEVGSQDGLNLVALVDRAESYSSEPLLNVPDWVGAKLLRVEQGEMVEELDLGDLNTGDPATLASFIAEGIAANPAGRYSLIISDHGAAWPGVGGDESSDHDSLTVAELQQGISAGLAEAGVDKLDLLGFDACLMATYEVATSMTSVADRMLASQELEPGHGWDYTALQLLADDPSTTADALGSALIDGFEAQAAAEQTSSEITLSLIDLTQMGALDSALAGFTGQMTEVATDVGPLVGRTLASTLGFGVNPDPTQDTHMADLGMLVSQIGVDALFVSDAADGVSRALNDVVVDSVAGSTRQGATGLSIYFPPTGELFDPAYAEVTANGGWMDFLAAYYGAGAAIPVEEQPAFADPEGGAVVTFDGDGVTVEASFDPALEENLSEATISYGIVEEDGTVTFFGEEPADLAFDGSGSVAAFYDLTILTMGDGEDSAPAYLTMTIDEESGTWSADVPLAYYAPGDDSGDYQDVLLTIVVDAETGDVLNETYYGYNPELETYGELTADPEGLIVPQVLSAGSDGGYEWIATSDVGLYADLPNLIYELEALPSGTLVYLELALYDFGGNSTTIGTVVEIP